MRAEEIFARAILGTHATGSPALSYALSGALPNGVNLTTHYPVQNKTGN